MSKLRAFRFLSQNETRSSNIEDVGPAGGTEENSPGGIDRESPARLQGTPLNPLSSQKSTEKETRECPQTPIGRLPLAELIAGGNEIRHSGVDLFPVERVLWNHSQQSDDMNGSQKRRLVRRGLKRAHSSSPVKSPNESLKSLPNETPKLQKVSRSLKTPQADPVNDLWSRYTLTTDRPSPITRAETALPSLHSSSPPTPVTHRQGEEGAKLRRSYSCNVEWPTSAKKRRKVQYGSTNEEALIGYSTHEHGSEAHGKSKIARVSLLVEQIQNRLARSSTQDEDDDKGTVATTVLQSSQKADFAFNAVALPSRASDLDGNSPETADVRDHIDPVRALAMSQSRRLLAPSMRVADATYRERGCLSSKPGGDGICDDYGEAHLIEMETEVTKTWGDAENSPARITSSWIAPTFSCSDSALDGPAATYTDKIAPDRRRDTESSPKLATLDGIQPDTLDRQEFSSSQISPKDSSPGLDEFDDDDSETFAADLENILAKYDAQPQPHVQQLIKIVPSNTRTANNQKFTTFDTIVSSNMRQTPVEVGVKSGAVSDDEFGEDFDIENIIAQCEEASQRPRSTSQAQSSVCTRIFGPSK